MSTFDRREEGFERKFVHDEEMQFRAIARRNKGLAAWAAEKLGKPASEADAYFKAVISADLDEKGDEDVIRKIVADFKAAGITESDIEIRKKIDELYLIAVQDLQAGR